MGRLSPSAFQDHFATLTDPRGPAAPKSRHLLMDILIIAVCAVISGAEGWEDAVFFDVPPGARHPVCSGGAATLGGSRTPSMGSLMSPLLRMPAEFAKTRERRPSQCCAILP